MKEILVRDLLKIIADGMNRKEFDLYTKVLLTDDDEINNIHSCWGYQIMTQEEIEDYFGGVYSKDKKERFVILG